MALHSSNLCCSRINYIWNKLLREQIWKTQQWPQDWKRSVFIPIPKKGNAKECSNYCTIALISHTSKLILKVLQARLQQYVNHELPDVKAGFRKGRGTRDQIANIRWVIEKVREFQKNIYFCFIVSPTVKLLSRRPTNQRTIIPKKFSHCCESSRPHTDFPTWGSGKGTESPRGIWLWRPVGFEYTTSTGLGKEKLTNKTLCAPGPRRREQWPHKRLSQICLWVFRSRW